MILKKFLANKCTTKHVTCTPRRVQQGYNILPNLVLKSLIGQARSATDCPTGALSTAGKRGHANVTANCDFVHARVSPCRPSRSAHREFKHQLWTVVIRGALWWSRRVKFWVRTGKNTPSHKFMQSAGYFTDGPIASGDGYSRKVHLMFATSSASFTRIHELLNL